MHTTLFKKLFLYWFIFVGLWGFGFTRYSWENWIDMCEEDKACQSSNCEMREVIWCCGIKQQICSDRKYHSEKYMCAFQSDCGTRITNNETKHTTSMEIEILLGLLVFILLAAYGIYKKLKDQKIISQDQTITQDNWVVVPTSENQISEQGSQIEAIEKNGKWDNTQKWLQKNRITIMSVIWLIVFIGPIIRIIRQIHLLPERDRWMLTRILMPIALIAIAIISIWLLIWLIRGSSKEKNK